MTRKISVALLATLFLFSLLAIPAFALDKKPDPNDRAPVFKHNFPTHMTIAEAEEYESQVSDGSSFANEVEETGFTPGLPASSGIQAESGFFNGIFAGNTTYDYQKNGTTHRQIQAGINPADGVTLVHVTWMCLKTDDLADVNRQVNYNCYDWAASPNPKWTLSGDDFGGISIIEAGERGGYTSIDVNSSGNAIVFHHSAIEGATSYARIARFAIPRLGTYIADRLTDYAGREAIWPRGEISRSTLPNGDIYHVVAQQSEPNTPGDPAINVYWRYVHNGSAYVWEGPVLMDSVLTLSHLCLADGNRVVIAMTKPKSYGTARNQYNNDLGYYESSTAGADWITNGGPVSPWELGGGYNCTDYIATDPHRAYIDITGGFDSEGRLHLMYNNPDYDDAAGTISIGPCDLLHWDEGVPGTNGNAFVSPGPGIGFVGGSDVNFHIIARANWVCDGGAGVWNRYLTKPTMGFGDGNTSCEGAPNLDYLYAVYTQFGSNDVLDQEDASANGWQNGNLWMSISNDLGFSWAAGKCITTTDGSVGGTPTRTPDCDPQADPPDTCQSEHWSSIAKMITDTLHVFYIGDVDAGGISQGEGNWNVNDVMYLPIFGGGDPNPLCPTIAPNMITDLTSDPNCEYYADDDELENNEDMTIENIGNAPLNYSVAIAYTSGSNWMDFVGYGQSIPSSVIAKGGAPDVYTVHMNGTGLPNGLYQASIQITHDDPSKVNPFEIDVDFFRADSFICREVSVITTPCVVLGVTNTESWAVQDANSGMRYYAELDDDSLFNPFYDGSLVIANVTATGGDDSVVYRDVMGNSTPYNPGFRALESPKVSYNAATNDSLVSANQVTVDSTIGISVNYLFPQETENCEFVRIKFKIYPRDDQTRDLIIGAAADIDCPGAAPGGGIQSENFGGIVADYNLVYQHGTDTTRPGGGPDDLIRVTNKYVSGMTALTCASVKRMVTETNQDHVYTTGGFTDGYIYSQMAATGNEIWADSTDDLHSIMAIEDVTLAPGDAYVTQIALVTSMAGGTGVDLAGMPADITDLLATTAKAWKKGFGWCGDFWLTGGSLVIDGGDGSFSMKAVSAAVAVAVTSATRSIRLRTKVR